MAGTSGSTLCTNLTRILRSWKIRNKSDLQSWSLLIFSPWCSTNDVIISGSSFFDLLVSVALLMRCGNASVAWFQVPALFMICNSNSGESSRQRANWPMVSVRSWMLFNASRSVEVVNLWPFKHGRNKWKAQTTAEHSRTVVRSTAVLCSESLTNSWVAISSHLAVAPICNLFSHCTHLCQGSQRSFATR